MLGSFPHDASTICLIFSEELCLQLPSSLLTLSCPLLHSLILSHFPHHFLAFSNSPRNDLTLSRFPPTSSHSQNIPPHFVLLSCPLPHILTFSCFPLHFLMLPSSLPHASCAVPHSPPHDPAIFYRPVSRDKKVTSG